jgi:hypothetical protein
MIGKEFGPHRILAPIWEMWRDELLERLGNLKQTGPAEDFVDAGTLDKLDALGSTLDALRLISDPWKNWQED